MIEMVTNNVRHGYKDQPYTVLLSDCDADLSKMTWTVIGPGYAFSGKQRLYLHKVILERVLGRPMIKGEEADHVNRNKLDNRRENIRLATSSQNKINRDIQSNNISGYRGVYFSSREKKWVAAYQLHGKKHVLGYFGNPEEAAAAYDKAAREAQGEFFIGNDLT